MAVAEKGTSVLRNGFFLAAFCLCALMLPHDADAALQRGPNNLSLAGYWPLDEATSTFIGDVSGNQNNGTTSATLTSWVRGKRGSALRFGASATSAYMMNMRNMPDTNGAMTISIWYNLEDAAGSNEAMVTLRSTAGGNAITIGYSAPAAIYVWNWGGNDIASTTGAGGLPQLNRWHHIVFTYDGLGNSNSCALYLNGQLVQNICSTFPQAGATNIVALSTYDGTQESISNGSLDDVRIYRRVLSAQEISNLYRIGGTPRRTVSNQGLLGYWSFDEGDGLQAGDSSGNRNSGVLANGATWGAGKRGKALVLDGANDLMSVDPGANLNITDNTYTLSLWYRKAVSNEQGQLLRKGQGGTNGYGIVIGPAPDGPGCANDQINFFRFNSTNYCLGSIPADTNWHHLVITQSSSGLQSYVDGVQNGSNGNTFAPFSTSDIFALGEGTNAASSWFGSIDEVRVYDRVLSDDEIRTLATQSDYMKLNSTPTRTVSNGLVGYWPFDGRFMNWATNRALDASSGGNNALLNNMSTTTSPMIGKIGQALNFDGSNDLVDAGSPANLDDLGSMSVCAWVNIPGNPVGYLGVASKSSGGLDGWQFYLYDSGGGSAGLGFYNTDGSAVERASTVPFGSWQHVCGTWDGNAGLTGRKIYLNGVELGSAVLNPYGSGTSDASFNLQIGSLGGGTYLHNGGIDDMRVYDRELIAAEVKKIYTAGQ